MPTDDGELLIDAAKLLYGERWVPALSREIGVSERTLRAITERRFDATGHPMVKETLDLLHKRHQEITRFLGRLPKPSGSAQIKPAVKARQRALGTIP